VSELMISWIHQYFYSLISHSQPFFFIFNL